MIFKRKRQTKALPYHVTTGTPSSSHDNLFWKCFQRVFILLIILAIFQIFLFLEQQEGQQIHSSYSTTQSKLNTQEERYRSTITSTKRKIGSNEDALQEIKNLIKFHNVGFYKFQSMK